MESRDSGHKRPDTQGGLVPIAGSQSYGRKILPYEKQLAQLLGISEQEYIYFSEELKARQRPRPAEYAHILDIRNETAITSALVSLAIGLVATAASVLLAPKPKQAEVQESKQVKLGDLTGPTRFNSTYGFDSAASLAQWGDVIPIAFGKYTRESGGLLITPALVWSRLFSYGNHQVAKLMYACGEYGLSAPNVRGIFMGNAPLDGSFAHNFTVYYRSEKAKINGDSRLKAIDLKYGTRATPYSGDPETFDDIFSCPTLDAEEDQGFCYAYTPGQNTNFGFYSPIVNGTDLRTNWKVVSLPELENQKYDPSGRLRREREKISGWGGSHYGMPGQGRGYGRQIGIIEYNNDGGWTSVSELTDVFLGVGAEIKLYISNTIIDVDFNETETGVNTSDLNNTSEQERIQADDQLQLGETFQIGRTIWVVTSRSNSIWSPGQEQYVVLRCVEQFGSPMVTVMPKRLVADQSLNLGQEFTDSNHIGLSSTPIGYQAMGIARCVRPCDVLEVGIKSRVFLQANGLCNFNEVPSPKQLRKLDEDGTTITNGTMNLYMRRSSCFTIKVRPISLDGVAVYEWAALAAQFVIRGNSPVDMYNFIRFYFPTREQQYEFRFEPLPGAMVVKLFNSDDVFYELDAKTGRYQSITQSTIYGNFTLRFAGRALIRDDLLDNKELGIERAFSPSSQVADVTHYPGLLRASNADDPEHEIVYLNEITDNQTTPTYYNMTMFGLSLRSGRNITGIDQLRFWIPDGINVKRWYPQAPHFETQDEVGRSNLFSDLLYFLLTDKDAGAGDKISAEMIDEESFALTAKFLSANKIFCDIVLQEPVNIRQWATTLAPLMLCNFTVSNGKFGIYPALPVDNGGNITLGAVPIAAIFTEGNIIEDTFECTYLRAEERAEFKALATYRTARDFELPERLSVIVRYAGPDTGRYPIEEFDMADWCTQEQQAILTCKYMLALRKHVTHAVSFKTSPEGLSLKPGDYIRVITQSNPFIPTNIGTIDNNGRVRSVEPFTNGDYNITYYVQGQSQDVQTGTITIQGGVVTDSNYYGIVFSISDPVAQSGVYVVEQLTLDQDCMVEIVASLFPCDENLVSTIARDVLANNDSSYWWISK